MKMPAPAPPVSGSVIIGGASSEHKRAESDFYPTPPECVIALLDTFPSIFGRNVWEPACGDGAISRVLTGQGMDVHSTDIRHTGFGQGGVDALCTTPENIDSIITNPPFSLATNFIEHLRSFHLPFALLLKATYWHASRRHELFKQTGPIAICPMLWRPNFAPDRGRSPTMDFCWTVWTDAPVTTCEYIPIPKPRTHQP